MNNIYQQVQHQQPIDILVLGSYNVGKSTLVQRFCLGTTPNQVFHTIGIQFTAKTLIHKQKKYRLKFWNSSGQKKYKQIALQYLKQACAIIFVYDITSYQSFHQVIQWVHQLQQKRKQFPILLYGNKTDLLFQTTPLKNINRQVTKDEAKQLSDRVDGVVVQGCGKTDDMLEKGIRMLIDKFFVQNNQIIFQQNQITPKCFCC